MFAEWHCGSAASAKAKALWLLAGDQLGNAADASNPAEESEASEVPATQAADSDGLRVFMPVSVTRPRPRPLVILQPEKAIVSGVSLKNRTAVPRMTHAVKGGGWKRRGASRVAHPSSPSLSRSWPRHQARLVRTPLRHMSEHRESPALREPVSAISLTLKSFASKSRRSAGTTSPVPRTTCLLQCNFEETARCFRLAKGRCRLRRRLGQVPALPSRRARPQARLSRAACPSIGTVCRHCMGLALHPGHMHGLQLSGVDVGLRHLGQPRFKVAAVRPAPCLDLPPFAISRSCDQVTPPGHRLPCALSKQQCRR